MHQEDRFHDGADTQDGTDEATLSSPSVVVRRNAGLAALVGGAACAIAIAYLWRAVGSGAPLDWLLCALMAGVGGYYLSTLLDARTPLVVADPLGVRIRLGRQWRGLPWDAVAAVELLPRGNAVRDGRLVFRPHSLPRALEGLEPRGRRAARLNQKLYGGALAVPLGLTTRSGAGSADLLANLAALCDGRSEVVLLQPEPSRRAAARTRSADTEPTESTEATEAIDAAAPVEATEPGGTRSADHAPDLPVVTALSAPPEPAGQESRSDVSERPAAPVSAWAPVPATPAEDRREQTDPDEAAEHGEPAEPTEPAGEESAEEPVRRPGRRTFVGNLGTIVSRVAKGRGTGNAAPAPEDAPASPESPAAPLLPAAVAAPLRMPRPGLRAQVTRDLPATGGPVHGATALHADPSADRRGTLPEGRELRRPGSVDLVFEPAPSGTVRPIARLGDPVEPLVIDDFVTEPAYDPVIGPELLAARTRLGLTVDELADRTRIRPHVIESIEVDDFAPCGGDFYARGHLRTLARVLGQDPAPLLQRFDDRYATAPINARRVFEAELATGMTGSMRRTVGGPNWGLLIGAVLVLVMAWGVIRLFETEPPALLQTPGTALNGSAGLPQERDAREAAAAAAAPMPVTLVAADGAPVERVLVRDGDGTVVWAGRLAAGERKSLKVDPPMTVRAADAGAVRVLVHGRDRGLVGGDGEPDRRTFRPPAAR